MLKIATRLFLSSWQSLGSQRKNLKALQVAIIATELRITL